MSLKSRSGAFITGIGETSVTAAGSGRRSDVMALEASLGACRDAQIDPKQVDGIVRYSYDGSISAMALAANLGCHELSLAAEVPFAGGSAGSLLAIAQNAVVSGRARNVLCLRAVDGRDWLRQLVQPDDLRPFYLDAVNYLRPVGWTGYLHLFGLLFQEHVNRYGTGRAALAHISQQLRESANASGSTLAPAAFTMEDYFSAPISVSPFTRFDEFAPADLACAIVVGAHGAAERSAAPVEIVATAQALGRGAKAWFDARPLSPDAIESPSRVVAESLYRESGLSPANIDVAELYDCTTFTLLYLVEEAKLCERGMAADIAAERGFVASGALPTNTHGGDLAGGYSHGFRHVLEAVRQVRGTARNQVVGAETALVIGPPAGPTSGAILRATA